MAFNLAKYNLNPFNVSGGNVRWLKVNGGETVMAAVGSALQIYTLAIGNERAGAEISGASTKFISASGTETVTEQVSKAELSVILDLYFAENIIPDTDIMAIITPETILSEAVTADLPLGADNYLKPVFLESVTANAPLGSNSHLTAHGFELVSESASIDIIDTKVCYLTATLAPGETIVIDADTYTVLLNGENAIEIQSGDWIDELDRSTTGITIGAASGSANLTATIIYTEKYL